MTRLIGTSYSCTVGTTFKMKSANDTVTDVVVNIGDVVNINYIKGDTILTVKGKVTKFMTSFYPNRSSAFGENNGISFFSKSHDVRYVVIDASIEYKSNVVAITPDDIVSISVESEVN